MRKGGLRYSSPQSPGMRLRLGQGLVDRRPVVVVEGEGEEGGVVGPVLALAEARADDRRRDRRLFEHPARRDIGDRDARACLATASSATRMLCSTAQPPIASMKRLYFILLQSAIAAGSGRAEPARGQEAAGERAVGEEADAVLEAEGAHVFGGAPVEERERDLVRGDRNALPDEDAQMIGVEIGDADMRGSAPSSRSAASSRIASR